jgi:hypothetical protein
MKAFLVLMVLGALAAADLEQRFDPRVRVSEGVGDHNLAYRTSPVCPENYCDVCGSAKVKLRVLVRKGGSVDRAFFFSGDSRLAAAAIRAVQQWRYQRLFLNQAPVQFETFTTVQFRACGI